MHKFGFVFPGQGSQKLGMLRELARGFPIVERTFAEASAVLGMDLWEITQHDSNNSLDQTSVTQPVLLTASVAIWRIWNERNAPPPTILAGHSLGEYSALVCADVLDFAVAVQVVHHRGQFMQEAVPAGEGRMAAIVGLDRFQINEICAEAAARGVVSAANFNSPGQTVIAGAAEAVELAMALCRKAGAKRALQLNVSVPSHCDLMRPAAHKLEQELTSIEFMAPRIPVVQNVNGEICQQPADIKRNLVRQLYSPVKWVDCVQLMASSGTRRVVECGPGKVLCGLIKRIDPEMGCFGSDNETGLESAIAQTSAW